MFYRLTLLSFFSLLFFCFSGCAPEFQTDENTYKFFLDENIRNTTNGYYRRFYAIADTALWQATLNKADTIVPRADEKDRVKFRSEGIWYEAKPGPGGLRAQQQYPGWEQKIDSIDHDLNLMTIGERQYMQVEIPAADIVLNGDSIRLGIIHPTKPAYEWNFRDYEQQPDLLVLTTYGNDTFPISQNMDAVGPISRQTIFRIGRHSYVLRYFTPEYDGVIIDQLEDNRGLPYTAELDLSYKPVPVDNLDGTPTSIMRTPGKELLLYFWAGFEYETHVQKIDSLYQALPQAEQDKLDIVFIAKFGFRGTLADWAKEKNISLPMYRSNKKTCLRLNCSNFHPSFVTVDGRGRIVSFYDWWEKLEERLTQ